MKYEEEKIIQLEGNLKAVEDIMDCYEEKLMELMTEKEFRAFQFEIAERLFKKTLEDTESDEVKEFVKYLLEALKNDRAE